MNKTKIIRLILIFILMFSFAFMAGGCSHNTTSLSTTEEGPLTVEEELTLYLGETKRITYSKNYSTVTTITFISQDPSVATVGTTGYVRAYKIGFTTVSIICGGVTYTVNIYVTKDAELESPTKVIYTLNETIDLTGAKIIIYSYTGEVKEEIQITKEMISGFDSSKEGIYPVTVTYQDLSFNFTVSIVDEGNPSIYVFKDPIFKDLKTNVISTIKLENDNYSGLFKSLKSLYDYDEFEISFTITRPSGSSDTIYSYLTQDFSESHIEISSMNSKLCNEGTVNSKAGYYYKTIFSKTSDYYYAIRYNPSEDGSYTYTMHVNVGALNDVYTKTGSFIVEKGVESKGVIQVDSNKKTFSFKDNTSYVPVGANVSWYTSQERRYNDYTLWMDGIKTGGYNYIRYWLAAWGGSLFWDNVKDYSSRLDEAYENDLILNMFESNGIYSDITIFQHGMFSKITNPMWKGSSNTWYTNKYGYNPYSDLLSSPGAFFTDNEAKRWTKNYLKYIVARYTSSDYIMSFELFNEVDWIEEYNAKTGAAWHDEMATYLKSIDYKHHMVTTSVKSEVNSEVSKAVFNLSSIDYANFHVYAAWDFLDKFSNLSSSYLAAYNKPVMIQECGYSGNGGVSQREKDPLDTSLHTELWGGIMNLASSGMPWWWESWIEPYDVYSKYKGASTYANLLKISGSYEAIDTSSKVSVDVTSRLNGVKKVGYYYPDRVYLYLYDTDFDVGKTGNKNTTTTTITNLSKASYTLKVFDTYTGEILETKTLTTSNNQLTFTLSFTDDVAIIIN